MTGIAMKRCAQCHGKLGLGVRSRNGWNGRWWVHVRYCSTHCGPFMSWSDMTPAPNVAGTHSYLAAVRRTDRISLWHLLGVFMRLQKAKSIARHLGLTLRQLRSGNYRVNFRDGNETTAYYTDKLEDAVNAVVAMARKRAFSSDCQADRARPQANAPPATAPG